MRLLWEVADTAGVEIPGQALVLQPLMSCSASAHLAGPHAGSSWAESGDSGMCRVRSRTRALPFAGRARASIVLLQPVQGPASEQTTDRGGDLVSARQAAPRQRDAVCGLRGASVSAGGRRNREAAVLLVGVSACRATSRGHGQAMRAVRGGSDVAAQRDAAPFLFPCVRTCAPSQAVGWADHQWTAGLAECAGLHHDLHARPSSGGQGGARVGTPFGDGAGARAASPSRRTDRPYQPDQGRQSPRELADTHAARASAQDPARSERSARQTASAGGRVRAPFWAA